MSQNLYDEPEFFEGYSQLARSQGGLDEAPEWPIVRTFLPEMSGLKVLDLGCGFGAFDRWAIDQGAESVLAIDLSEKMLAEARSRTSTEHIEYIRGDLTELDAIPANFDLVYSALALHYAPDIQRVFVDIRKHLVLGGRLVVTVEHPIFTAPSNPEWTDRPAWPLDNYALEGRRITNWISEGVVKYHRTIATYVNSLIATGFSLKELVEWTPSEEDIERHPDWEIEVHRPMFLLLGADAT